MKVPTIFNELLYFIFPNICCACDQERSIDGHVVCVTCLSSLPYTNHLTITENAFVEHFWGRVPIVHGAALLHYITGEKTQVLLHNLKYRSKKEVGLELGRLFGERMKKSSYFIIPDVIIPVPLHKKKKIKRGYNQSALFGQGLSDALHIPQYDHCLVRTSNTSSQTKKSRSDRIQNVLNAFKSKNEKELEKKHILIVDDVLTTGATLEACALALQHINGIKISMATIAIGK